MVLRKLPGRGTVSMLLAALTTAMLLISCAADANSSSSDTKENGGGGTTTSGVTSVTISGNSSVKVGSQITLAATPDATPSNATYTWTVTDSGNCVTYTTSTTSTLTLTGKAAGTVTVKVSVDGVTSAKKTITVTASSSSSSSSTTLMWNASDYDAQDISSETTLGIMTLIPGSNTLKIASSSATIDGEVFTKYLQLGGGGSTTSRALKFTLTDTATVTVYAVSGSTSTERTLNVSNGTSVVASQALTTATSFTVDALSAGTYYIYSAGSGINVYGVKIVTGSLSVSSVTISGNSSVKVGSQITLTATPNVSTSSAYTWTVTGGSGSASGSSTTNTLTLTGVTAGTVTVTAKVDGVTSAAYTVTVKEAGTSPTISLSDTPTGYAGYGSPSYYAGSSTITINASDANAASTLMTYVKKGNYVIYINGMIDVTSGKLPDSWEDTGNALGSFISSYTNGTYTSWTAWRKAYAGACDKTSHYTTGQYTKKSTDALVEGTNDATLDAYQTALATAWKKLIQLPLASNTTIIGLTDESGIRGANISISGISNIMLRNLHLQDAFDPFPHHEYNDGWNSEYDCITIQNTNSYIWIDHCTFEDTISVGWADFAGVKTGDSDAEIIAYPCNSTGTATTTGYEMWQTYDGLCDIKGTTSNVTISYCVFQNHDKTMLIGNSDSESVTASTRTITLHHNKFYGCVQRLPMARLSYIHNFNNYYSVPATSNGYDQKAAVNARYGVYINSEYNYFDSGLATSYNSSDSTAHLYYANDTGATASSTDLSSLTTSTTTPVFTVPYTYSDILDPAADVPDIVAENAGAGVWSVVQ